MLHHGQTALAFELGDIAEARTTWLAALPESEAIGALPLESLILANLGEVALVDGKLDEAVWKSGALVDNLHQTSPIEYAVPDERTEIYLLYDDEALYIGALLHDPEPDKITANNLRQADNVGQDDRFYVTIDPFLPERRAVLSFRWRFY